MWKLKHPIFCYIIKKWKYFTDYRFNTGEKFHFCAENYIIRMTDDVIVL